MKAFDIKIPPNCSIGQTARKVEHVLDSSWVLDRADGYFPPNIIRCLSAKKRDHLVDELVNIGIQPEVLEEPHKEPRVKLSDTWWFRSWAEREQRQQRR